MRVCFLLSVWLFLGVYGKAIAQVWMLDGVEYNDMVTRLIKGQNINQTEILNGAANKNFRIRSDVYLSKTWNLSTLNFYDYSKPIDGYVVKYEIQNKQLEILVDKSVKLIDCSRIKNFIWIDSITQKPHYFVNGKELSFADAPVIGFLEVLTEGNISLFSKVHSEVVNANYNPLLSSRPESPSVILKELFFIEKDKKVFLCKKKKDFLSLFQDKNLEEFIDSKRYRVSNREDLIAIVSYYNSLAAAK